MSAESSGSERIVDSEHEPITTVVTP